MVDKDAELVRTLCPDLYRDTEVAAALCLSERSVRLLFKRGMPFIRIGGRRYLDRTKAVPWIIENCTVIRPKNRPRKTAPKNRR
jgi:hypothetical protein